MRKKPNYLVTFIFRLTGIPAGWLYFKAKRFYENGKRYKIRKPFILMSNHTSLMDFILYMLEFPFVCPRFLVAEVIYKQASILSWLVTQLGCIKVDRNAFDFSFVADSLDVLDKNGVVGIFPQGRLPVGDKPFPYHPSVVFIALRTEAPIIPIYTDGQYGLFKRAHYIVGQPIYLRDICKDENPSKEELQRLTEYLENKTWELKAEMEAKMKKKQ